MVIFSHTRRLSYNLPDSARSIVSIGVTALRFASKLPRKKLRNRPAEKPDSSATPSASSSATGTDGDPLRFQYTTRGQWER